MENIVYRQCSRCILDTKDDSNIYFNEHGICNHCLEYESVSKLLFEERKAKPDFIKNKLAEIKAWGKNKAYDCIMGVSGGVDSTYLCYKLKELGIRPLLVHFDNGWNSELAVNNIENMIKKLGFDLYTYVVDWNEFRDLQLSYFKAGVMDLEVPTDHGFYAALYKTAAKKNIKYIISGHNIVTEYILPQSMIWRKLDLLNLKSIHKKFGTYKLKTFPQLGFFENFYFTVTKKFEMFRMLNYMDYDKEEAKKVITKELNWRDYGGKHYESVFTRFFQGYILPEKFGVDKRKAHLSNLVCSGQITKEEALKEFAKPAYDPEQLATDKEYVIKKLGMSESEFETYMKKPKVNHSDFPSYTTSHYVYHKKIFAFINKLRKFLNPGRVAVHA